MEGKNAVNVPVSVRHAVQQTDCNQYHNESVLKKYQERLKIGEVKEQAKM